MLNVILIRASTLRRGGYVEWRGIGGEEGVTIGVVVGGGREKKARATK